MKYCRNCGNELDDNARFCSRCGARCDDNLAYQPYQADGNIKRGNDTLQTVAKIFMILSCVSAGFLLFPLLWMVPMTIHYFRVTQDGSGASTAFKVCTLLFVNILSGILMLCDN